MEIELNASEMARIAAAKRFLKIWRYVNWASISIGTASIGYAFFHIVSYPETPFIFDILHPVVLTGFGAAVLAGTTQSRKRAKDSRLILKFAQRCGQWRD